MRENVERAVLMTSGAGLQYGKTNLIEAKALTARIPRE
jgi:hypothetical protein